jgi:methionine synthase I (cobalamin-dependent)
MPQMIKNGASLIGGCCGTDPGYIKIMAEIIKPNLQGLDLSSPPL